MKKISKLCCIVLFCIGSFSVFAAERTIPVDIFLMIDKSLSMQDPGKFDSLQKWVLDELISQMLIPGDWVTIYQFYEKPEHVLTTNVQNNSSLQHIYNTVKNIKPDGHYTDIGYALDTVQQLLDERGSNGRFKVLLMLTDLVQDAPWTSKYRGKQDSFNSPYLVEARTIKHDNWYEITLDMDIQDAVVQRTQSLYSDVVANDGIPRTKASEDKELIQGETRVINSDGSSSNVQTNSESSVTSHSTSGVNTSGANTRGGTTGSTGSSSSGSGNATTDALSSSRNDGTSQTGIVSTQGAPSYTSQTNNAEEGNSFPLFPLLVGLFVLLLLIILILVIRHVLNEKKKKEEAQKEKIALVP